MTKTYKSFSDYLDKSDVVSAGVGFATGLAVNKFFSVMINDFVLEVIKQKGGRDIEELKFTINGIDIVYGHSMVALINLAMVLIVSYVIIKSSNRFLGWS